MRLNLEPDVLLVGETGDGFAAPALAAVLRPHVILVDVESTNTDDAKLVGAIRNASPESAVVILSLRDDPSWRQRALAAGAAVFVSKHEYSERLLQAIRHVATL